MKVHSTNLAFHMWDELTIVWNDLTILWNDLTIDWNDLTMERNDRIPSHAANPVRSEGRYPLKKSDRQSGSDQLGSPWIMKKA